MSLAIFDTVQRAKRFRASAACFCLFLLGTAPSLARDSKPKDLPDKHREWLEIVEPLMTKEERRVFLGLEEEYRRDAFIAAFWRARDPDPATPRNEFREGFEARRAEAIERFDGMEDDRARIFTLRGEAADVRETDCGALTWPLEIWSYGSAPEAARPSGQGNGFLPRDLVVIFFQPGGGGPFRLWRPAEGYDVLLSLYRSHPGSTPQAEAENFYRVLREYCADITYFVELILDGFTQVEREGGLGAVRAESPPAARDREWLASFLDRSSEPAADAEPLAASLEFRFPARHQSRAVAEGVIAVPRAQLEGGGEAERTSFNFLVTGEVLRDGELFESFRYQFDLPRRDGAADVLSLVFERYLRPGDYEVVLKLEELGGGRAVQLRQAVAVPALDEIDRLAAAETDVEPQATAASGGDVAATLELASQGTDLRSGMSRFDAVVSGEAVRKVAFYLDGRPVLTKNRPPYSVELSLGSVPTTHTVRAIAFDAAGNEVATDELLLNPGEHGFFVRLIEPQGGRRYAGRVRVRAEVVAPDEQPVERLEVYLGEERLATLFQPPWVHSLELAEEGGLAFVRAVAFLVDGNSTEELVVLNAADFAEEVEVRLVELHATVLDERRRPAHDLERGEFTVLENGEEQSLLRFERLDDQPVYASLLLDTSGSMDEHLEEVRQAALRFLEATIEPRDRASVVTFSDRPRLAAGFTSDREKLAGALAGLRAGQSTALWDSVVFALYQFKGLKGQKALLLLTDGQDRNSKHTIDDALRFAQTTGVTIYVIGLNVSKASRVIRGRLGHLAEATGGRRFFMGSVDELDEIYAAINRDLRSRYLLVYQPPAAGGDAFRAVEVRVARPGHEVRSPRGYYP